MKKNIYMKIFCILLVVICYLNANTAIAVTRITYQEDTSNFLNPERGWFWVVMPPGGGNPGNNTEPTEPLKLNDLLALRAQGITAIRHNILIPKPYHTGPMSQAFLDTIDKDWNTVRQGRMKLVLRPMYIWGMTSNDPVESVITTHVQQLDVLIRKHADVVAAVNIGLFGGCGEMISSDGGYADFNGITAKGIRVCDVYLAGMPKDRSMMVRLPRQKRGWINLGFNDFLDEQEAYTDTKKAKLGYANQCFIFDWRDANFYEWGKEADDRAYFEEDSKYLPVIGEPSKGTTYALNVDVVSEMAKGHWTFCSRNQGDCTNLYDKWIKSGELDIISKRIGYRFRLNYADIDEKIKLGATFKLSLNMTNDGFARPINPRKFEVILRKVNSRLIYRLNVDKGKGNRLWLPGPGETKTLEIEGGIPRSMPPGKYEILLNLPDPYRSLYAIPEYSIRLANTSVWETKTGFNSLKFMAVVASNSRTPAYRGKEWFVRR